jgi:ParB family transcriptional regulator, chromosome partitioning protein
VESVRLDAIADDATFRLREPGDVSGLASSIGRLGQLEPVELRPLPGGEPGRYQVVAGFRRVAALRMLQRERVLARVHAGLADEDAWALALAGMLFAEPSGPADWGAAEERVRSHLPWALPILEARRRAAARSAPASPPASPASPRSRLPADPASFSHALAVRAYELNGDVAAAHERWASLPREGRELVLAQLRYVARILPILEKENR